jgi:hypothetical protein
MLKVYLVYTVVSGFGAPTESNLNYPGDKCIGRVTGLEVDALTKGIALAATKGIDAEFVYVVEYEEECGNETPWGETHSAF